MNKQTLIVLAGGLCAALLVALIMQSMLTEEPAPVVAEAPVIPTTQILVAANDLTVGDELTSDDMKWQDWPDDALFPGAIIYNSEMEGAADDPLSGRLKQNVAAGQPLTASVLVDISKGNFLAASLAPGKRAMAISVKANSSVGGFVMPGDYVDVIMTYDVRLPADDMVAEASVSVVSRMAAQTILENIRVVAVDQEAKEMEEAKPARTVTLELGRDESEKLALAAAMGDLSLALRSLGDDEKPAPEDTNISIPTTDVRMSNVMQELLGSDGSENTTGVSSRIVRVYNGAAMETMSVRPYIEVKNNPAHSAQ